MVENFLTITTSKGSFRILHRSIIRVLADGPYSYIFIDKEKYHCCKHLKAIRKELKPSKYLYKVHRSHIVNMDKITGHIKKGKRCFIIMNYGAEIPISKREKKEFMKRYKRRKRIVTETNATANNRLENKSSSAFRQWIPICPKKCLYLPSNEKCPLVK